MNTIPLLVLLCGLAAAVPADNTCSDSYLDYYSDFGNVSPSTDETPFEIYIDDDYYEQGDDVEGTYFRFAISI